jgi:hypothetical protein
MDTCLEAVFGTSKRPFSFCRRPHKSCVINIGRRRTKDCGLGDAQACGLRKPDHLIVLYQQSQNDDFLLRALSFSAFARKLPHSCYGRADATAEAAKSAIRYAKERLKMLAPIMQKAGRVPFLLPIGNYSPGAVIHLLRSALSERELPQLATRFVTNHWADGLAAYSRPDEVAFKPAVTSEWHGGRGGEDNATKALKTEYRLGCSYDPAFHYDVSRPARGTLRGVSFTCSRQGQVICAASHDHINIYPDDFVRGAHAPVR